MSRNEIVKKVASLYQKLDAEWKKKNLPVCGKYLSETKILMTQLQFLPANNDDVTDEELIVARSTLEIGVQWSIAMKDVSSFERYMAMLKIYYTDFKDQLAESPYMYEILGLDLLCLLSQNKLGQFHTALELLPSSALSNVYIRHPVNLEQFLMEGSYNKIYLAKGEVPSPNYAFFIDELLSSIRTQIAECIEKAYDRIRPENIAKMLYFSDPSQVKSYCQQRGWSYDSSGYLVFGHACKDSSEVSKISHTGLAEQMIVYAKEMETIV